MTETKALVGVEVKSASEGRAIVKFAAYNEIDHHNDVTIKGAFKDGQKVVVSAYNHQSWGGSLPVGKGTIRNSMDGKSAVGELQFFMSTEAGRDTFETVKELGELQQWSYGFDIEDAENGDFNGKSVRFLKEVNVHEISPVLVGAGKSTATLAVKSREGDVEEYDMDEVTEWLKAKPKPKPKPGDKDEDKKPGDKPKDEEKKPKPGDSKKPGKDDEEEDDEDDEKKPRRKKPGESGKMRMSDHCIEVLTSVKELADRAEEIVALRQADGKKGLAPETQVLLDLVSDQLKRLDILANSSDDPTSFEDALIMRSLKNLSEEM